MAGTTDSRLSKLAEHSFFIILARLIFPPIAGVAIAVGSYYLAKTSQRLDHIETEVHGTLTKDELFSQLLMLRGQARDHQINSINQRLDDHEGRIRNLERAPR